MHIFLKILNIELELSLLHCDKFLVHIFIYPILTANANFLYQWQTSYSHVLHNEILVNNELHI